MDRDFATAFYVSGLNFAVLQNKSRFKITTIYISACRNISQPVVFQVGNHESSERGFCQNKSPFTQPQCLILPKLNEKWEEIR